VRVISRQIWRNGKAPKRLYKGVLVLLLYARKPLKHDMFFHDSSKNEKSSQNIAVFGRKINK
jgi:hypothetical protein